MLLSMPGCTSRAHTVPTCLALLHDTSHRNASVGAGLGCTNAYLLMACSLPVARQVCFRAGFPLL